MSQPFYFARIGVDFGCKNCRVLTTHGDVSVRLGEEILVSKRDDIFKYVPVHNIVCPNCSESGYADIIRARHDGYLYEYNKPEETTGRIKFNFEGKDPDIKVSSDGDIESEISCINACNFMLRAIDNLSDKLFDPDKMDQIYVRNSFIGEVIFGNGTAFSNEGDLYSEDWGYIKEARIYISGIDQNKLERILGSVRNSMDRQASL